MECSWWVLITARVIHHKIESRPGQHHASSENHIYAGRGANIFCWKVGKSQAAKKTHGFFCLNFCCVCLKKSGTYNYTTEHHHFCFLRSDGPFSAMWETSTKYHFVGQKKQFLRLRYVDVSENRGTPKSSILIGFSIINHPFWGYP